MQRSALCRSRRELSNEDLLAKIGVDTAENEPLEVWGKIIQYYSFVSLHGPHRRQRPAHAGHGRDRRQTLAPCVLLRRGLRRREDELRALVPGGHAVLAVAPRLLRGLHDLGDREVPLELAREHAVRVRDDLPERYLLPGGGAGLKIRNLDALEV